MKGSNLIIMNQATMVSAIQLWLDHNFKNPPVAVNVSNKDEYKRTYEIQVEEKVEVITPEGIPF